MLDDRVLAPARTTVATSGGWALLAGGATGAASALYLAFVPPAVGEDQFSFPLGVGAFTAVQLFFCVHHLALAYGLFAVWRSGLAGTGRLAAVGGLGAALSMAALAAQELVVIGVAEAPYPSPETDAVGGVYGVLSLLNGAALIVFGVAALRAGRWQGWRRSLLLATGVYVIVPLTPAIMGPFVLARLTIGGWMLLFAALGWALLHPEPARPSSARADGSGS